ncbi:MAG TPA: hypothetical protein DEQ45_00720 [Agrobacterium sp.]|nr:hypothetical protein [Agrobacterium sp.]
MAPETYIHIERSPPQPSFLCSSQESSRRASARRKESFSPRTWAGWIPVTSTGMREASVANKQAA